MTDSKGKTSWKALEWAGNHLLVSRGGLMTYRVATVEDIAAALLANPEARMAVLAALGFAESVSVLSAPAALFPLGSAMLKCDKCGDMVPGASPGPCRRCASGTLRPVASSAESCGNCHKCKGPKWLPDRMLLCPTCGNKRCPKASDHELACTGSNEPGQPGSIYVVQPATAESGKDSKPPGGSTRKDEQCNANPKISPADIPGREFGGADVPDQPGGAETVEPAPVAEAPVTDDSQRGLYRKYEVTRLNDSAGKHAECEYFVLDLEHDKFAPVALVAYARVCADEFPVLSRGLSARFGADADKLEELHRAKFPDFANVWAENKRLKSQQEQLERELAELRKELDTANYWRKRHSDDAQASGEQSNRNWQEAQALRAKLSESERKLVTTERLITKWRNDAIDVRDHGNGNSACLYEELADQLDAALVGSRVAQHFATMGLAAEPAAKEPTGGEPAKPGERRCPFGCLQTDGGESCICAGCRKATPPAAEAEPRFRVGQPVGCHCSWPAPPPGPGHSDFCPQYMPVELDDEPADPAPPRPGRDRPVMMGELSKAARRASHRGYIRDDGQNALQALAEELEREGGEKP